MKVKKLSCLMLCCVLTAGIFSSCSGGTETSSVTSSGAQKSNVTLTYAASRTWVNRNSKIDDELNQKFEKETGIHIDFQISPDDQYTNVLETKLSTGEAPDIFMVGSGVSAEAFKPDENFADLSNEKWVSRYCDYAKRITKYQGKTIGFMTWSVDGYAILYNPDIYAKYNLSVPKTFKQFQEVCNTLLKKGITPIYQPGKELWHWGAILSQCGPLASKSYNGDLYADLNNNKVKLADIPVLAKYLDDLKTTYTSDYMGKNDFANSWDSAFSAMASGKYASIITYEAWQSELLERYPNTKADKWEMYPIPFADNDMYSPSASAIMRVAYKNSPHLKEVKEFFDFLAEQSNLQTYYDKSPAIQGNPSFTDVTAKPTLGHTTFVSNAKAGSKDDLGSSILYWSDQVCGQGIQEMLMGSISPKEVLASMDSYRQKMFNTTKQ